MQEGITEGPITTHEEMRTYHQSVHFALLHHIPTLLYTSGKHSNAHGTLQRSYLNFLVSRLEPDAFSCSSFNT